MNFVWIKASGRFEVICKDQHKMNIKKICMDQNKLNI